jgi:copper chaperone NosL
MYIVAFILLTGLMTAIVNRRALLWVYASFIIVAGAGALADFYLWGYDYGHNLDPTAPIVVPGMSYQPPVIGTKQLLNFTAFSGPDIGGWIFLASGLLALVTLAFEIYKSRTKKSEIITGLGIGFVCLVVTSCSVEAERINYGKDACHHCKMTLMDNKFGAETDFASPEVLIDAKNALYVKSEQIKSPMASNVAAFHNKNSLESYNDSWKGKELTWSDLVVQFK